MSGFELTETVIISQTRLVRTDICIILIIRICRPCVDNTAPRPGTRDSKYETLENNQIFKEQLTYMEPYCLVLFCKRVFFFTF